MVKDLTQGKPSKVILIFSLPLLLSMVFQQLYNMADSIIAGNTTLENCFVSNSKISQGKAVQPCSPIVNEEL